QLLGRTGKPGWGRTLLYDLVIRLFGSPHLPEVGDAGWWVDAGWSVHAGRWADAGWSVHVGWWVDAVGG
ncbi:MAG: hypothetical protein ACXV3F_08580, partial [Frankiaceae bacterium]